MGVKGSGNWAYCPRCGQAGLVDELGLPVHRRDEIESRAMACTRCQAVFKVCLRYLRPKFGLPEVEWEHPR